MAEKSSKRVRAWRRASSSPIAALPAAGSRMQQRVTREDIRTQSVGNTYMKHLWEAYWNAETEESMGRQGDR